MKQKKVQLHGYISKGTLDRFKSFVKNKHAHQEKGDFSFELEQALGVYMAHTHGNDKNNPSPKAHTWKQEIKDHLFTVGYQDVYNVPLSHVEAAIHQLYGTDKRTVQRKLDLLESYGCIKFLSPSVVEFV